jgi:hypothetical protein
MPANESICASKRAFWAAGVRWSAGVALADDWIVEAGVERTFEILDEDIGRPPVIGLCPRRPL